MPHSVSHVPAPTIATVLAPSRPAESDPEDAPLPWSALLASRITGWGVATTAAAVGLILHKAVTPRSLLLVVGVAVFYWLAFVINDYFDASSDAHDESKARHNVFIRSRFARLTITCCLVVLQLALFALFVSFGILGIALYALANVAMWSYSAPPFRVKNRPGIDLLFCGIFGVTFPYIFPLLLVGATWSSVDGYVLPISLLAGIAGQLRQQIRDFEVDSRSEITFTTTVGVAIASRILTTATLCLCGLASLALLTRTVPLTFLPVAIIGAPVLLECALAPARRPMPPMSLYQGSAFVALCYVLVWLAILLRQ
jgi:hypothetical protein